MTFRQSSPLIKIKVTFQACLLYFVGDMVKETGDRPLEEEKHVGDPSPPYKSTDRTDPDIAEAAGVYGDIATAEEYGYVHRG